jgi:drug/metabolite transporter (DMT)-like permease
VTDAAPTPRRQTRAIVMLLLTTAAWGFSFPGTKSLLAALDAASPERGESSWYFAALAMGSRFALGALILLAARPRSLLRATAREWRQGLGLGLLAGVGLLIQADGLAHTAASTSAFLTQLTAVLVPLGVALRDRRWPTPWTALCVTIVMAGCAVLARVDLAALRLGRGELETLASALFFSAQMLWLERPGFRGNDAGRVTLVMFATIAAVLAPVVLALGGAASDAAVIASSWPALGVLLGLTLLSTVFAFLTMNRFQPQVSATTAGIIYCAEPLFGTALALFLPALLAPWLGIAYANETFTPRLVVGGGLITLANVLIALRPLPPRAVLSSGGRAPSEGTG